MTSPPEAQPRSCCTSYNGYAHQPDCTRKGGRPVTTGASRVRHLRIRDAEWEPCAEQASTDGQTMADFVREALTRELARRRSDAAVAALESLPITTADHPHTDPGDGRTECDTCGKFVWPATHSCKRVPVTLAARARWDAAHGAAQ